MIPLFINLTILIGLIATVGMAVYSYQRSAETVSLAQRNAARMEQVSYAIRSGLRPGMMGGPVLVPLGDPDGPPVAVATSDDGRTASNPSEQVCIDGIADYNAGNPSPAFSQACRRMTVPRWLVSDDRTPWGARYAFCPYSVDGLGAAPASPPTATGTVRDGGGASYNIRTVLSRGRPYVLQSDAGAVATMDGSPGTTTANEEVVGFLLSPPPHVRDKAPRCRDVAKVAGSWLVVPSAAGAAEGSFPGSVVPILSRGVGVGQVANQGEVVLYAADRAMGTGLSGDVPGTGDNPAHAMTLADALDLWHQTPFRSTTIRVKGGTYAFSPTDTVPGSGMQRLILTTALPGRSLRIDSSDGSQVTLAASGGPVDLALGVDAVLDGITLGAGVQLRPMEGSNVAVTNGRLGHIRVDGGNLSLGLGTSVAHDASVSPYSAIDLISGRLSLSSGGTLAITGGPGYGVQMFGGDLILNGTDLSVALAAGGTTVTPSTLARVLVAPRANGSWPAVYGTDGTNSVGGVLGREMTALASSTLLGSGCDTANGNCQATCQTREETQLGIRPSRIAVDGSCYAGDTADILERPTMVRSGSLAMLGGDPGVWACSWKAGDVYTQSAVAGGGMVRTGAANFPVLAASARCIPNASFTLPGGTSQASR